MQDVFLLSVHLIFQIALLTCVINLDNITNDIAFKLTCRPLNLSNAANSPKITCALKNVSCAKIDAAYACVQVNNNPCLYVPFSIINSVRLKVVEINRIRMDLCY